MSNFDHFVGTRAVSGNAFDTAALSAWLAPRLEGLRARCRWRCSRAASPTPPTS
jgi:hypothetical protein